MAVTALRLTFPKITAQNLPLRTPAQFPYAISEIETDVGLASIG